GVPGERLGGGAAAGGAGAADVELSGPGCPSGGDGFGVCASWLTLANRVARAVKPDPSLWLPATAPSVSAPTPATTGWIRISAPRARQPTTATRVQHFRSVQHHARRDKPSEV